METNSWLGRVGSNACWCTWAIEIVWMLNYSQMTPMILSIYLFHRINRKTLPIDMVLLVSAVSRL